MLLKYLNAIISKQAFPEKWKTAKLFLIPKAKKDIEHAVTYRTYTFTKEQKLAVNQFGFKRGQRTRRQMANPDCSGCLYYRHMG